jgi:capsular polysaccharide biosynthesis protein
MQSNRNDDEIEIDLKELFFEIMSHWKMVFMSAVLVGSIAFIVSKYMITPQYESTSQLYVLSKSTSITSLADIQTGTNLTSDYMVVVKGRTILEQVINNLGLNETFEELAEKITLNNPANSRILEISVKDPSAHNAKKIADEMAEVASAFIAEKMDQDSPTTIQAGYADGEAVSPTTRKNALLGAGAGFALAIAMIVIAYLMNDTIITVDDVEQKLGIHLLGTLPFDTKDELARDTKRSRKAKKSKKKFK